MDEGRAASRKAYRKPEVVRVDLVENEVALASCKTANNGPFHSTPNTGTVKCNATTCKSQGPS